MALVNMRDLVYHAYENRYAICSFDLVDIDFLHALLGAAEQSKSSVILNISENRFNHQRFAVFMAAVERAVHIAHIPVAIQIDKITTFGAMHKGIKYGCNAVKLGDSDDIHDITGLAHRCGITVEGSAGNDSNAAACDIIAVPGASVWNKSKDIPLDFQLPGGARRSVNIPLAMDCDIELRDDNFDPLIDNGVAKLNLSDTVIGNSTMKKQVLRYMHLSGSAGQADAAVAYSRPWRNVEHLIVYNTSLSDENGIRDMINRGTVELARIPGVREVVAGKAIHEDSKFRYTWLIRFCSREVVEFYKEHPVHKHFADNHFRPYALERITTDYEILNYHEGVHFDQDCCRATG